MGYSGSQDVLRKNQMCCGYRKQPPDFSARRIYTVSLFIFIFITDFKLTDLECEILNLNNERYIIYGAKESVLNLDFRLSP